MEHEIRVETTAKHLLRKIWALRKYAVLVAKHSHPVGIIQLATRKPVQVTFKPRNISSVLAYNLEAIFGERNLV